MLNTMLSVEDLIIDSSKTIKDAMRLIDNNGCGTCFVIDNNKLFGVITDGDIRRDLIKNNDTGRPLSKLIKKEFIYLPIGSKLHEIQDALADIDFIPIVDNKNVIVDYASRARYHQIPLIQPILDGNELEYITECINTGWISSQGSFVRDFEKNFSKYTNSKYSCTVSNGTVALHLALVTLGIKPNDEVIVPDLTFAAPVNAVIYSGARPVLVDVDRTTMAIDIDEIKKAITKKTKAIIPVHLYGHPAPMKEIMQIAKEYNLIVIEDCAEALGSFYERKHVGNFGDAGTFSFFGNKTITTGEGGMIIFKEKKYLDHAMKLRDHGMSRDKRYWHDHIGFNYRLTNLQAAVGVAQMEKVEKFVKAKQFLANEYSNQFKDTQGLKCPINIGNVSNSYWLYTIVLDEKLSKHKDKIIELMLKDGVEARPIFNPIHLMPPYKKYNKDSLDFKNSIYLSESAISLPSGVNMEKKDIIRAANSLKYSIKCLVE